MKQGDYIRILSMPGRKFVLTVNYRDDSPLVECQEVLPNGDLSNGYSPFRDNVVAFETDVKHGNV
jgi:hypothetical protein